MDQPIFRPPSAMIPATIPHIFQDLLQIMSSISTEGADLDLEGFQVHEITDLVANLQAQAEELVSMADLVSELSEEMELAEIEDSFSQDLEEWAQDLGLLPNAEVEKVKPRIEKVKGVTHEKDDQGRRLDMREQCNDPLVFDPGELQEIIKIESLPGTTSEFEVDLDQFLRKLVREADHNVDSVRQDTELLSPRTYQAAPIRAKQVTGFLQEKPKTNQVPRIKSKRIVTTPKRTRKPPSSPSFRDSGLDVRTPGISTN